MASRLWQLVFLKHFKQNSSRHLVWNRNNRLHTRYKKHAHKERKETTHVRVGEKHTLIYKEYKYNVCQNGHKTHVQEINVSKVERKEKDT